MSFLCIIKTTKFEALNFIGKRNLAQLSKISDILCDAALDKKFCTSAVKKATAFNFWKDVCGSRFAKFSSPYDIKGTTLVVAVKSPQVMQELIFHKEALLSKLKTYFLPLNIKINDIRYDYKVWNKVNSSFELINGTMPEELPKANIARVLLDESEKKQLKNVTNTILKLSFLSDKQKEDCANNIINLAKAKKLQEV